MKKFLFLVPLFLSTFSALAQVYSTNKPVVKQYEKLIKEGKILEADKIILEDILIRTGKNEKWGYEWG